MKVVIINGVSMAGKDKFVSYFNEIATDLRVKNYSSIDRVKQIAEICFDWDGKKNDKSRRLLSEMKRIWTEFNDGPFDVIKKQINADLEYCDENNKDKSKNIYFLHVREPEEILKVKNYYNLNCITLLVKKDVNFIPDNYSDRNVEYFDYDYIIDNNKSEDELKKRAREFLSYIKSL